MINRLILWIHRWLGLISGLVVLIVSLTGCIYVFADELREFFYKDRLFVEASTTDRLPLSVLLEKGQEALGESYPINRCDLSLAPDRSWIFRAIKSNPDGLSHWDYFEYYYRVYINPFTGEILKVEDSRNEFFQLILSTHMTLLLGHKIGKPIIGWSVLIFVILLISGLILWWPSKWNKHEVKKAFQFSWKSKIKRLNYDLHNVLGFYSLIPAIVIAITGLVYSFVWFEEGVYFLLSGGQTEQKRGIHRNLQAEESPGDAFDECVTRVIKQHPQADLMSIRLARNKKAPVNIQVRLQKSRTYHFVWYYFDRATGKELTRYGTRDLNFAESARALNYDLHVGSFLGIPGKILAFLASLICTSLPVTGFFVWFNKKKKTGRSKKTSSARQDPGNRERAGTPQRIPNRFPRNNSNNIE